MFHNIFFFFAYCFYLYQFLSNGRYKSQDQVQDVLLCSNVCCCNWPFISQFVVRQGTHFLNVMCFVEKFTSYISEIICFRKKYMKICISYCWAEPEVICLKTLLLEFCKDEMNRALLTSSLKFLRTCFMIKLHWIFKLGRNIKFTFS